MDNMNDFLLEEMTALRRELHMYPEKGLEEYKTSKFIEDYLRKLDLEVITGVAGTGVIGIMRGTQGKHSIAIRADMDCLEVEEGTCVPYASRNKGLMHACGHDGHMSALLGLAKYLSQNQNKYRDNILFIFQPAEEGPGGAEKIVKSGVLQKFNMKAFLGMHIFPEIKQGYIGCCSGPITARNGEIDIEITGKSGHGALPHTGIDSIVVASELIQAIQTIITRKLDPRDNAVVTLGKIKGGEARNIICGKIYIEGTIRSFSESVYNSIKESIFRICQGLGIAHGCSIKFEIRDMYREVYNDEKLFDIFIQAAGKDNVEIIKPLMISEDFSYYKDIAPEIMFLLGSKNEEKDFVYPLHNYKFNFDESILVKAVSVYKNMIDLLDGER